LSFMLDEDEDQDPEAIPGEEEQVAVG
jgi:hypothetical protein